MKSPIKLTFAHLSTKAGSFRAANMEVSLLTFFLKFLVTTRLCIVTHYTKQPHVDPKIPPFVHHKVLYCPEMNPIEEVFSQVKRELQKNAAVYQSCQNPRVVIYLAFMKVKAAGCAAYIKHAGYKV